MNVTAKSSDVYVYGFVRSSLDLEPSAIGIKEDGAPAGIYIVRAGTVAAVVSARARRASISPTRRHLEAHRRVISRVLDAGTILPFAFGQVAGSEEEVLNLLRTHESSIGDELDRLDGKVQMGLKVHWDVENIFQYVIDADPEMASLCEHIFASPAPLTLDERIDLGKRFEKALETRRAALVESIVQALPWSVEPPQVLPVREEKAVADLMFMIQRSDRAAFEESVRQLAASSPDELVFRVTGPWAPFNFVELELSWSDGGEKCAS